MENCANVADRQTDRQTDMKSTSWTKEIGEEENVEIGIAQLIRNSWLDMDGEDENTRREQSPNGNKNKVSFEEVRTHDGLCAWAWKDVRGMPKSVHELDQKWQETMKLNRGGEFVRDEEVTRMMQATNEEMEYVVMMEESFEDGDGGGDAGERQ